MPITWARSSMLALPTRIWVSVPIVATMPSSSSARTAGGAPPVPGWLASDSDVGDATDCAASPRGGGGTGRLDIQTSWFTRDTGHQFACEPGGLDVETP